MHKYHSTHTTLNFTPGWLILLTLLLECINYTPWRWFFGGWIMLEWHTVLIKWWLYNIWETTGIWYSKCTWCTCRYTDTQCQSSKFYSFTDIIIIIYLSWGWANCWPVLVSRIQKSLQRSAMIPSASWRIVFHYPG